MNPELYEEVKLIADVSAAKLKVGDRVIVIDYLEHPQGDEMGAVLELSQSLEREQYVVTVPVGVITALNTPTHLAEGLQRGAENVAQPSILQRVLDILASFTASVGLGKRS